MRKVLTLILINIILGLFQTSLFPVLFGKESYINWILVFCLSWILINAPITALKTAFVGGIVLDILNGARLGLSPFILTLGVYLMLLVRSYLFRGFIPNLIFGTLIGYIYAVILFHKPLFFDMRLFIFSLVTALLAFLVSKILKQIILSRRF